MSSCWIPRIVAATLVLPLSLSAAPVLAQTPAEPAPAVGEDVVNLKNGGMVRGKIIEVIPEDSVTIVSASSGQSKNFPWAEVAGYERGDEKKTLGEPAAVQQAPAPVPEAAPTRAQGAGFGTPRLHIEPSRDVPVQLFEITAEIVASGYNTTYRGISYRPVCTTPCGDIIDGSRGQSFFFGGDRITTSRRFTLSGEGGDVVASVKPGRRGLRVGGLITMGVSIPVIVGGGLLLALAKSDPLPEIGDMGEIVEGEQRPPNYAPGTAVLLTGVALLVGGIVMYVLGRTKFKLSQRGVGHRRPLLRAG